MNALEKLKSIGKTLAEACASEHQDFTTMDISRAVVLLAIPMILELSLESVFAVVDMFFVGRLGQNAIATVGLTESVMTLIYSLAIGITTGTSAVVARRIGEKNPHGASHASAQALGLAFVLSCFVSALGSFFAGDILHFMGASAQVVSEGAIFTRILLGGAPVIFFIFLINGIFRGAGDAAIAMRSLWLASGMNIVLCPILIHFLGIKGAALATLIGRTSGVFYQCYHLLRGKGLIHLKREHFTMDWPLIQSIGSIAWPASLQFIIGSGSWIVLAHLVAVSGGTAAIAGYQVAFRNFIFFILPAWGLSNAAATLVGQNLGANLPQRAEASVYTTAKYSLVLMMLVTIFFFFYSGPIVGIFSHDLAVLNFGKRTLEIISSGYVFYGIGMVMTQALNGAGDTRTPTWLNLLCFWPVQIPLAYTFVHFISWGAIGAVYSIPLAQGLFAILAFLLFRRGRWKKIQV